MTQAAVTEPGVLTHDQRRLVTGIVVIAASMTMVAASFNYILAPMLDDLGASESQSAVVRQLPSIAALLVVFLGGVLGDRFGDKRMLYVSAGLFGLGSLMVAVAPVYPVAALGLVVQSIGISAGAVIALGFMSAQISDPGARASAFSVFAIVSPVIYLVLPILSGALVDNRTWRLVPALWVIGGLVSLAACRRLLPSDAHARGGGEIATPVLAGLVLAAAVQTINAAADSGVTSRDFVIRAAVTLVGLVGLVILFRRLDSPSVSLAALRRGGMLVLLAVVLLVPFANLWYYATMSYQYVFGLDTLQTALAMVPAQLGAIAGAMLVRKTLQKRGVSFAGTASLFAFAATLLTLWAISVDSPLWVPILSVALYAAAFTAAGVPITNAIMNTAERGQEGSASAWRSASAHIGAALGVVFTTILIGTVMTSSLTTSLTAQGIASAQSREIVDGILDGASSENLSSQYSVPIEQVDTISADVSQAMIDGLHTVATSGSLIAVACAVVFFTVTRSRRGEAD